MPLTPDSIHQRSRARVCDNTNHTHQVILIFRTAGILTGRVVLGGEKVQIQMNQKR